MKMILADTGIPMLFWQMPVALIAILPIVLIESLVALPIIKGSAVRVQINILVANALSTFVGVPITWIALVFVNMFCTGGSAHGFDTPWNAFQSIVLQASWLIPYDEQLFWLIPAATLVLLVPYFLISVYTERFILCRLFRDVEPKRVTKAAWLCNLASYGALAVLTAFWLVQGLAGGRR